jgi:flagellin
MPLSIHTSTSALASQRHLAQTGRLLATTVERLSSGLRINRASDDASGLAIAERMLAQLRGSDVAVRNANEAISMAQLAEATIGSMTDTLQRMRELAVQAANGSLTAGDRDLLQAEYADLASEVARAVGDTAYLGTTLLDDAEAMSFQVGPNRGDAVEVNDTDLSALPATLGTIDGADATTAGVALDALDAALETAAAQRSRWGAVVNRFDTIVSGLTAGSGALAAARGRIVDADYAAETAQRMRLLIQQEVSVAMLTQANTQPQLVLRLLAS